MTNINTTEYQLHLSVDCIVAAMQNNFNEVKNSIEKGADPCHVECDGYNALLAAIINNKLDIAEYLLREHYFDKPVLLGRALFRAKTPEAVKLLAQYDPDIDVLNEIGLAPRDLFINDAKFDLVQAYDECGLSRPLKNSKMDWIASRCTSLYKWSLIKDIVVPQKYYDELAAFKVSPEKCDIAKEKKILKKVKKEIIANAQNREAAV